MKSVVFIIACCAIFLPLVVSSAVFYRHVSAEGYGPSECERKENEEDCDAIGECEWFFGECLFKVVEGCGFAADERSCAQLAHCVWMAAANDHQNSRGTCKNKEEISEGNCVSNGYVIASESGCNSVTGCSWIAGDSNYCAVALT